jgi:AraC family transcriptional regulator, transcriptional activator of pobA
MEPPILSQELKYNDQKVFFAFRTMEENHLRTGGKPDVPHRHEFYTILLIKDAKGKHVVDYVEFEMKPNMVFLLSPGQVHQVISDPNPSGDIIMFNDEFLERNYISRSFITNLGLFSCQTTTPPLRIPDEYIAKLSYLSDEIRDAFAGDQPFMFDIIASHLKLFLIECNRFAPPSRTSNLQTIDSGSTLLRSFRDLLETRFQQWRKVSDYASQLNISPDYLNEVVKSNIGKTAKELIMERVILEAKRLGLHTHLSTKEISYQLGFEDPSHFSKLFKNETSELFSEFRKRLVRELQNA